MSTPPVFNVDDADLEDRGIGGRFQARLGNLSAMLGARKLGYNVVELSPGKVAWPYHFHHVNEELFVILEGTGKVRYGDREHAVRTGDLIACPPGPDGAHQIINDSDAELRYLAISTCQSPEIAEFPDSGKVGVFVESPGGEDLRIFVPKDRGVGYWDGEEE